MKWVGHIACMDMRNAFTVLVGEPQGKKPVGSSKLKCEDKVQMYFKAIGCEVNLYKIVCSFVRSSFRVFCFRYNVCSN
jgi:hypothetical protein